MFCLIYGTGVMFGFVVFVIYDREAMKSISKYILSISLTPKKISVKRSKAGLRRNEHHLRRHKSKLFDHLKSTFFPNVVVPSYTDIELEIAKNQSEHHICWDAAGISSRRICKLQILSQQRSLSLLFEILNENNPAET